MKNHRLWGRIIRNHRIVQSETVEITEEGMEAAFLELCRRFDVQRPLQLPKHNREFEQFGRTAYTRGSTSPSPSPLTGWRSSSSCPTGKRRAAAPARR